MPRKVSRLLTLGVASVIALGVQGIQPGPAAAHEAKCPHCKLDVVQDTAELDNEVALRYGRKRIEYRCVMCAVAQAKKEFTGDLTIIAPSEVKGKPVLITRKDGKWSAPKDVVFVGHKVKHRYCQTGYRAFSNKAAFDAFVAKNQSVLKGAKPMTLEQMVAISK